MGKLSKLVLIGLGTYAIKYYLDNPEKAEEHQKIAKEKIDNSIGYTKCMWNYTKKNGVAASAEYLKNDFEKVVKRNAEKLNNTFNETVEFGKQMATDTSSIRDNALDIRDKGIELSTNISEATKVLKDEITPAFNNYISEVKGIVNNISAKTAEIKETIKEDAVDEKIADFKEHATEVTTNAKEVVEELSNKEETEEVASETSENEKE